MRQAVLFTAAIAICGLSAEARADDCATVFKAYSDLSAVPSYASTMTQAGMVMKAVVIGETVYANADGQWTKVPLKAGGRLGMLKSFVPEAGSLQDCKAGAADAIDGKAMATYSYVVPVPEEMKAFAGPDADKPQTVWIGVDDGLPHKMVAGGGIELTIAYDGVVAPIP